MEVEVPEVVVPEEAPPVPLAPLVPLALLVLLDQKAPLDPPAQQVRL